MCTICMLLIFDAFSEYRVRSWTGDRLENEGKSPFLSDVSDLSYYQPVIDIDINQYYP